MVPPLPLAMVLHCLLSVYTIEESIGMAMHLNACVVVMVRINTFYGTRKMLNAFNLWLICTVPMQHCKKCKIQSTLYS